jgi:uncharacterized protein (TIGR00375 family)
MRFIADLHIHSKYSRATAKNLDLENIWIAAQLKGISVVGTGDFTHPAWFSEIEAKLEPAEPGLFRLKENIVRHLKARVPSSCQGMVRFILVSEISNIYKKKGKTRKNHNLVFAPSLKVANAINSHLNHIGNIHSDGRPILGLDARNLLEIVLEENDDSFLIPAHIWTPWFSALGSKSGFDSIEECFEDLTEYIFALETGLSSDPSMNWRVSSLDRFSLVSNSDAHSPMKLGREANLFNTDLSYFAIRAALKSHDSKKFLGTFEFYPEEGKYHVDGHRKCQVRLFPKETLTLGNRCPVCGKPLTLGVLHRVEQLADRKEPKKTQHSGFYHNLIPLEHVLSELLKVGPGSKKVQVHYQRLIHLLGPEFDILHTLPADSIKEGGTPLLKEALLRVRENKVHFHPGYDGEFGKVQIFSAEEREELLCQKGLFQFTSAIPTKKVDKKKDILTKAPTKPFEVEKDFKNRVGPAEKKNKKNENKEQHRAIKHLKGPLLIVAGPGTGKTYTLTQRIFYLIEERKIPPEHILAVTFTRKAALEMRTRLMSLLRRVDKSPLITTFHGLCWQLIRESDTKTRSLKIITPDDRSMILKDAMDLVQKKGGNKLSVSIKVFMDEIVASKQSILGPNELAKKQTCPIKELELVYSTYQRLLNLNGLLDFEDVIFKIVKRLKEDNQFCNDCQQRFPYIFVDEYQDLNEGQYQIIRALASDNLSNICVIGDPDQAIYGFRGSDVAYFNRFKDDYPFAKVIHLIHNYRSTETVLESSFQVIKKGRIHKSEGMERRTYSGINGVKTVSIMSTKSEKAEAVAIGRVIEQMIGGMGFHALDFDKLDKYQDGVQRSFSEFAILFRTHDQGLVLIDLLEKAGIPCQLASHDRFYNQPGIRELLKFLNLAEGFGTFTDFEIISRSFTEKLSPKVISMFKEWAYENKMCFSEAMIYIKHNPIPGMSQNGQEKLLSFIDFIKSWRQNIASYTLSEKIGLLSKAPFIQKVVQNRHEFAAVLKKIITRSTSFGSETAEFIASLSLDGDIDNYDDKIEKVALMTMHAAKGLEFPIVFIAGCEDGLIPFQRVDNEPPNISEERRLFYVAMTRAKEMLFMSWASKRNQYGQLRKKNISPFVMDIEKDLQNFVAGESKKHQALKQTQLSLF